LYGESAFRIFLLGNLNREIPDSWQTVLFFSETEMQGIFSGDASSPTTVPAFELTVS
jgi:hypothetical protein